MGRERRRTTGNSPVVGRPWPGCEGSRPIQGQPWLGRGRAHRPPHLNAAMELRG